MWEIKEVNVGRARVRRSVPGRRRSAGCVYILSVVSGPTNALKILHIASHLIRPLLCFLIPRDLRRDVLCLFDGCCCSAVHASPPSSSTARGCSFGWLSLCRLRLVEASATICASSLFALSLDSILTAIPLAAADGCAGGGVIYSSLWAAASGVARCAGAHAGSSRSGRRRLFCCKLLLDFGESIFA